MSDLLPCIPEFFSGKNVFLTGGSGFLGKALIEKLLRSCPCIGNIYVLIRDKKGKSPEERLKEITQNAVRNYFSDLMFMLIVFLIVQLYDKLKRENPSALQKIKAVVGDISQLELGKYHSQLYFNKKQLQVQICNFYKL